jgi:hypothetical protein
MGEEETEAVGSLVCGFFLASSASLQELLELL